MVVDLGGGERVALRRALVLHAQHWMAEKVKHRAAGDSYNADYDQQRIEACDRLSDKLRLAGPASAPEAGQEPDPFESIRWAISALDSLGHDLETGVEAKAAIAKRAHERAQQLRELLKGN